MARLAQASSAPPAVQGTAARRKFAFFQEFGDCRQFRVTTGEVFVLANYVRTRIRLRRRSYLPRPAPGIRIKSTIVVYAAMMPQTSQRALRFQLPPSGASPRSACLSLNSSPNDFREVRHGFQPSGDTKLRDASEMEVASGAGIATPPVTQHDRCSSDDSTGWQVITLSPSVPW